MHILARSGVFWVCNKDIDIYDALSEEATKYVLDEPEANPYKRCTFSRWLNVSIVSIIETLDCLVRYPNCIEDQR